MTLIALVGVIAFAVFGSCQQQSFVDYEFQGQSLGPHSRPPAPAGYSRAAAVAAAKPTPVPIIKQINRHNDDGSYTYGYEGADGSFKIETKLPTGEVSGKYGYVDDTGKLRVVDYGANRYGFQPAGEGITVAPPTLVDETTDRNKETGFAEYDEEGLIYARPQAPPVAASAPRQPKRPRPVQSRPVQFAPQPQYVTYESEPRTAAPTPISLPQVQQFTQQVSPQYPQQTFIAYESQPKPAPVSQRVATPPPPARVAVQGALSAGPLFRPTALPAPIAAQVPAAPRPAPVREQPIRTSAPSGSVLDQLIQQFALPQGVGQPLHDISFGSFSTQTRF